MLAKYIEQWKDLRFGMFIHWGVYSLLGRGEWVMYCEAIDKDEYRKLMHSFTADKFDAHKWAQTAKAAGMKYMVLTTRHHDGFALWDSKSSSEQFTSVNSAAKRDFVREYVEACRAVGLKVGLYYSPLDWRFPGYFFPKMYAKSAQEMRTQCHEQIRELLTQYGKIDIFWFDGGEDYWLCHGRNLHKQESGDFRLNVQCPGFWGAKELNEMIRTLQPGIIINNRSGNREFGDFLTPEAEIGAYNIETPWESNIQISGTWGWVPGKQPASLRECIRNLVRAATGDGNLLLNVGPRPDGSIEEKETERLDEVGTWLRQYGESVYATRGGPFCNSECGGMTYKENVIYVHIWEWKENVITLPAIKANIKSISSITADDLQYKVHDDRIIFTVGEQDRLKVDIIIKIELDCSASTIISDCNWCLCESEARTAEALIVEKM